jgi:hypothetical protein
MSAVWRPEWDAECRHHFRRTHRDALFHRARTFNEAAATTTTRVLVSLDADVLFPPDQYRAAWHEIVHGRVDMCYPFDRPTRNIARRYHRALARSLSLGAVPATHQANNEVAVGGCAFFVGDTFKRCGMENINFVGYGPEDRERDLRMRRLGCKVTRVPGPLFHLAHRRSAASRRIHHRAEQNSAEFDKVDRMTLDQLTRYVAKMRRRSR